MPLFYLSVRISIKEFMRLFPALIVRRKVHKQHRTEADALCLQKQLHAGKAMKKPTITQFSAVPNIHDNWLAEEYIPSTSTACAYGL